MALPLPKPRRAGLGAGGIAGVETDPGMDGGLLSVESEPSMLTAIIVYKPKIIVFVHLSD